MIDSQITIIDFFLHSLSAVSYLTFFALFLIWILIVLLAIMVKKNKIASGVLFFVATILFFVGPFVSYYICEFYFKKTTFSNVQIKQLKYAKKVIIKGVVTNNSKIPLKECRLIAVAFNKYSGRKYLIKKLFKPDYQSYVLLKSPFKPNEKEEFYITLNGIKDYKRYYLNYTLNCN